MASSGDVCVAVPAASVRDSGALRFQNADWRQHGKPAHLLTTRYQKVV
jgi:hypothetical protein